MAEIDPGSITTYYRDLLAEAYAASGMLSLKTGRKASDILDQDLFLVFLREAQPGSLASARRVRDVAMVHLGKAAPPGAWWHDLLEFESACFLQLATQETPPRYNRPRRGVSAFSNQFNWDLLQVVEGVKTGAEISPNLRRKVSYVFARRPGGAFSVREINLQEAAVFRATNGMRLPPEIAQAAGVSLEETNRILNSLANLGAVLLPPEAKGAGGAAR